MAGLTTNAQQIIQSEARQSSDALPEPYWELVQQYRAELVNQALAIVGNLEDAEDIVQETLCEALRDQKKLTRVKSLSAWLRTINKGNALNRLRDRTSDRQHELKKHQQNPPRSATTGGFNVLELRESVAQAIEALPEKIRRVVVLRFWSGLSGDEIAAQLGLPSGTVRWQLCEAYALLHKQLAGFLQPVEPSNPKTDPTSK